jgi:hypothetical protein
MDGRFHERIYKTLFIFCHKNPLQSIRNTSVPNTTHPLKVYNVSVHTMYTMYVVI